MNSLYPVSYTHLDVYKRQVYATSPVWLMYRPVTVTPLSIYCVRCFVCFAKTDLFIWPQLLTASVAEFSAKLPNERQLNNFSTCTEVSCIPYSPSFYSLLTTKTEYWLADEINSTSSINAFMNLVVPGHARLFKSFRDYSARQSCVPFWMLLDCLCPLPDNSTRMQAL